MNSIGRAIAKLVCVVAVIATVLTTTPSHAQNIVYVSATGSGTLCTAAQPCGDVATALLTGGATVAGSSIAVFCLSGTSTTLEGVDLSANNLTVDIDCPIGFMNGMVFNTSATNETIRLRHLAFRTSAGDGEISFYGNGTLILEDCVFADENGFAALDIEPNGPLNLVIRNSRISNSGSGILLKPNAGGSIKATLDHVTITNNSGGGLKLDSTYGSVTVDVTDSEISGNGGNGMNAVGGAGGPAMFNISRGVIAKNGAAGLQTNGANAAALVDTTLFDTNASGATSVAGGGHLMTYGNNRIVGTAGSGFTGSAAVQ